MSSKKNKTMNRSQRYEMDLPEVVDMDVLSYATDSEIRGRQDHLEQDRTHALHVGQDPTPWEVELAYVQREVDIRRKRSAAHERFVRSNPEAAASNDYNDESNLDSLPN